jgi:hypothetical protein
MALVGSIRDHERLAPVVAVPSSVDPRQWEEGALVRSDRTLATQQNPYSGTGQSIRDNGPSLFYDNVGLGPLKRPPPQL